MNLQGIVSVSGKPGLWRALAQNKTGYVLESLDTQRTKLVVNLSTAKLAALHEITIFGYTEDIKLTDVFERIKIAQDIPDIKADGKKLREFFREIAPDHDEEKVYASDIKKVIIWYHILKGFPLFDEDHTSAPALAEETAVIEDSVAPQDETVKPEQEPVPLIDEVASVKPKVKKAAKKTI